MILLFLADSTLVVLMAFLAIRGILIWLGAVMLFLMLPLPHGSLIDPTKIGAWPLVWCVLLAWIWGGIVVQVLREDWIPPKS